MNSIEQDEASFFDRLLTGDLDRGTAIGIAGAYRRVIYFDDRVSR